MSRLYRPSIPVAVKCAVVLRQLGEMWPDHVMAENHGKLGALLASKTMLLAAQIGCSRSDLRLDHDPPLAARPRYRRGLYPKTFYVPDANDPEHLFYRPHGPQFAGSHLVKTVVRGDHGQFSDIALIKRERRRQRKAAGKVRPKAKIAQRKKPWPKGRHMIQSRRRQWSKAAT